MSTRHDDPSTRRSGRVPPFVSFGVGRATAALALVAVAALGLVATAALGLVPTAAFAAEEAVRLPRLFSPAAEPARTIFDYSLLVIGLVVAIGAVVGTAIAYTVVRFRHRPGDEAREPPQVYGSNQLELAWTVIPIGIVVLLALVTSRNVWLLQAPEWQEDALRIEVTGHQWWWSLEYPAEGVTTANEIHVPVGRRVLLALSSADVIHSFWVPDLAGKMDLVPGRPNWMWFVADRAGTFLGQCAEYCGTQHAHMLLRVVVHEADEFDDWVDHQRGDATAVAAVADGRRLFETTACVSCHTVRGTDADGRFGPDLTHLMSRRTLAAGAAPNDREHLVAWITDPDHLKPGARMPAMKLDDAEIALVVDYLHTLD